MVSRHERDLLCKVRPPPPLVRILRTQPETADAILPSRGPFPFIPGVWWQTTRKEHHRSLHSSYVLRPDEFGMSALEQMSTCPCVVQGTNSFSGSALTLPGKLGIPIMMRDQLRALRFMVFIPSCLAR